MTPPAVRRAGALLLAAAIAWLAPALAFADAFEGLATTFRKAVASDDAEARLRAFQRVQEVADPRVVDLLLEGAAKEAERTQTLSKEQSLAAADLEAAISAIEKGNAERPPASPAEIERFNKKMRELERKRDAANARLREIAVDLAQGRAVLGAATAALGTVLDALPEPQTRAGLERLGFAWAAPKSTYEERLRWIDTLVRVRHPAAEEALRKTTVDASGDPRLRAAALDARIARGDAKAPDDALAMLAEGPGPTAFSAIDALRRLHRKEAIEPLIAFLPREDVGEGRTRAHVALRSLTGQTHGPYAGPWADWWKGARSTFVMPERPADVAVLTAPEKGVTFYGITTFSDRILFVLDVSGSMLEPAHPESGGARGAERKIDVLRRELAGAIDLLDEKKRFNVLFFSHRIVRYQGGALVADRPTREQAKKFAVTLEPSGGTNIHDALETAFRVANASADGRTYQAVFDTIYFMTDGTPTAGKLQKPDAILEAAARWNAHGQVTVHCIGVGQGSDDEFLKALAGAHHGQFVKR